MQAQKQKKVTALAKVQLDDPQTKVLHSGAISASAEAKLLVVKDDVTATLANNLLINIAKAKAGLEDRRKFLVKPLNDHVKAINGMFKPALDALESANENLRSKVLGYRELQRQQAELVRIEAERLAMEAEEKARKLREQGKEKAAKKADAEATTQAIVAVTAVAPARVMATDDSQVTARTVWTFEIEDAGQVPDEYRVIDESLIRAAVRSGLRAIPGVRIFSKESLAVGGL